MKKISTPTSLITTLTSKGISISDKRCENLYEGIPCNRKMFLNEEKEPFCFYCQEMRKLDDSLGQETKAKHETVKLNRFIGESLINPKLANCTFDNFETVSDNLNKAKSVCQQYAERFNKDNPVNLMLIGSYGLGKSHLTAAILKDVIRKNYTCMFISTPKLFTKIKATYNKNSNASEGELLEAIEKVDLLVLDDIGAENTKDPDDEKEFTWAKTKLFEIIDGRIGKHTIFTTNFEHGNLLKMYGERNFSRMLEGTHVIKMQGDNYRLRNFK